uniref:DNA-directed RNA polymerase n=1 Tax=Neurospora intermedia TaxID=5142 RepID=Q9XM74_NEUIN|nr:RNA polymerase [Neurospora intermedia]
MIKFYFTTFHMKFPARLFSTSFTLNNTNIINEKDVKYITKNFLLENSNGFNLIKNIINSDETSEVKQKKIEVELNNIWHTEITDILQKKRSLGLDAIGTSILAKDFHNLIGDIENFINKGRTNKLPGVEYLKPSLIISIVLGKVIPFSLRHSDILNQPTHSLFAEIGKTLKYQSIFELHHRIGLIQNRVEEIKNSTEKKLVSEFNKLTKVLDEYKNTLKNLEELSGESIIKVGLGFTALLSETSEFYSLEEQIIAKNKSIRYILPKNKLNTLINNITLMDTIELPMIIPPLEWKIDDNEKIIEYGGTILNNKHRIRPLRTKSVENSDANDMTYNKELVDAVNFKSKIPYIINLKLLDFITRDEFINRDKKDNVIIYKHIHPDSALLGEYMKDRKNPKISEITTHNSKFLYHSSIISIAKLMKDVKEFYMTVFIDWRGRFYTSSCALNIQGGELARSLLLFKEGQKLNDIGLKALKIYTANAFGLDKRSKEERLDWVEQNLHKIIDIDNYEIWREADEPLLFLACALELKGYKEDPNFISHLPILMDATCNGLQHLSAMVNDFVLAEKVNLLKSTENDNPRDLYSEVIPHIKQEILEASKSYEHTNLERINVERCLVKRGLMTITYGATERGIYDQIVSKFFQKDEWNKTAGLHFVCIDSDIAPKDVVFTQKNILLWSKIIYNSLFKIHPNLNTLMVYFNSIVKVLCELDLPVNWVTPYGLVIQQKYNKFTKYNETTYVASKRYKLVLRKADTTSISKQKQIQAFIPNFVHSMDGSNIVLLIKTIRDEGRKINFASIHDCFATHANDTAWLSWYVKQSFIRIYSDSSFLRRFHNYIQLRIQAKYGEDAHFDKDGVLTHVTIDNGTDIPDRIDIPKPLVVNKDNKIYKEILHSEYFIN